MRDHVEVEDGVSLDFDYGRVNHSAVAWVEAILAALHEHTVLDVAVDQTVEDLGLVSWLGVLEQVSDHLHLMLLNFSSHGGTTHTVSVNDDLLREAFSIFLIITHGIINEVLKDVRSLKSNK